MNRLLELGDILLLSSQCNTRQQTDCDYKAYAGMGMYVRLEYIINDTDTPTEIGGLPIAGFYIV